MQLDNFTTNITVDAKPLEEYDIVFESPTKVTCWVPSKEGKSFAIQWKCHEQSRVVHSEGSVHVDGKGCGRGLMSPGALGVGDTVSISCFIHAASEQSLVFARVQLTDDDSLLDKRMHKDLGEISLVITRGQQAVIPRPAVTERSLTLADTEQLHERSKKATVHCVGFGPQRARVLSRFTWQVIPNGQPQLTFVFKYRPLDVLQANGIAPRPVQVDANAVPENGVPERTATPDSHASESEDVKPAELNDRIQNLESELKRLRDLQAGNSQDRKTKRIKREEPQERRKSLFAPGEVIDLT